MHDQLTNAVVAIVSAVVGILVGWAGGALTMVGRVDAIEASVARLESTLHAFVMSQAQRQAISELPELRQVNPTPNARKQRP